MWFGDIVVACVKEVKHILLLETAFRYIPSPKHKMKCTVGGYIKKGGNKNDPDNLPVNTQYQYFDFKLYY